MTEILPPFSFCWHVTYRHHSNDSYLILWIMKRIRIKSQSGCFLTTKCKVKLHYWWCSQQRRKTVLPREADLLYDFRLSVCLSVVMCYLIKKLNLLCHAILPNELYIRDMLAEKDVKTSRENALFSPFHQLNNFQSTYF